MLPVEYESKVVTEILVERVTSYYMLNFTLVVGLLTVMSWVSFFLSATDLNDRATLSLTIILALNVFQLIMNDSMPKTGYLTPLTQFIIGSTFFAAFATVESVAVFILNRRTVTREEVIQKFRSRTQSAVSAAFGRGGGAKMRARSISPMPIRRARPRAFEMRRARAPSRPWWPTTCAWPRSRSCLRTTWTFSALDSFPLPMPS